MMYQEKLWSDRWRFQVTKSERKKGIVVQYFHIQYFDIALMSDEWQNERRKKNETHFSC
jgi:hypothetical protein